MSQRALIAVFAGSLVAVLALSVLINWGVTSAIVAAATVEGPMGPAGANGADGQDGKDGVDGQDGAPGEDGTGATGQRGLTGARGPTGPTGPAGDDATAPPIVRAFGAGTASVPQWPTYTPVTGAGLTLPAGVYSIVVDATDMSAVTTSGGGSGAGTQCVILVDGGITNESSTFLADGSSNDFTLAILETFAVSGVIDLRCDSYYGAGQPVTNQVSWTDIVFTATRLD